MVLNNINIHKRSFIIQGFSLLERHERVRLIAKLKLSKTLEVRGIIIWSCRIDLKWEANVIMMCW